MLKRQKSCVKVKYRSQYGRFIMKWKSGVRDVNYRNMFIKENGDLYYNRLLWGYVLDDEYYLIHYDEHRLLGILTKQYQHLMQCMEDSVTDILRAHLELKLGEMYAWLRTHNGTRINPLLHCSVYGGKYFKINPENKEFLAYFGPRANDILILLQSFPRFIHYSQLPKDKLNQALMLNQK